ncbi:MAG TPA: DNA-directed RNA polymerase subunit omega [Thermodesulfobacteriota bacterium]|jgi:DNA-directed RNA polymerase subunit omega|nr:DNA-directed RNA polymerase subunit omega [Thermodesulfobacteriota bacterium]
MARVTIEDCLKQEPNRYFLIHGAIKRTIQLKKGATPLVNAPEEKLTVIALREIAQGKVKIHHRNNIGIPGENSTLT